MREREPDRELAGLDPAVGDLGYWGRFERSVMAAAAPELARRREQARMSVPEVVTAWGRLIVPGALAAGLVAGFFLAAEGALEEVAPLPTMGVAAHEAPPVESGPSPVPGISVDDADPFLPGEEGYDILPAFLASTQAMDRDVVHFAIEGW